MGLPVRRDEETRRPTWGRACRPERYRLGDGADAAGGSGRRHPAEPACHSRPSSARAADRTSGIRTGPLYRAGRIADGNHDDDDADRRPEALVTSTAAAASSGSGSDDQV